MSKYRMGVLSGLIALSGCSANPPDPATASQQAGDSGGIVVNGVVRRVEVSGGCWQLVAGDSTRYELRAGQAPADLLVDQKHVTVTVKPRPDLMSTCMVGKIVDVVP
ncbi:MAG TPA: hypothetical protein VG817_10050 [Gemmatimonadales bacterium]|nr:hypothetical protein [Gemmatimonadales bacterium]